MILASADHLRAARLQKDLAYFAQEFWGVLEPGTVVKWNWHMDLICKYLEKVTHNEIRHLLISVPPGSAKSFLVSVCWPAWEWLSKPWETTIFASNAEDLAERDSIRCRQLVGSTEYQEVLHLLLEAKCLPMTWGMHPQLDKKDNFGTTAGGFRQALTVNKPITGKRPMKAVIDDPTDASEVTRFSQDLVRQRLDDVFIWYAKVLSTRLNDVNSGHFVVIMQRLHELDLVGRLKSNPNYTLLCLPMEYDPEIAHPEDPRTTPGELLHPDRFPQWWVDEQKREDQLGRIQYAAQHGQRPLPADGGMFRQEFFRQRYAWQAPPAREEFLVVLASFDIANKARKKNDRSSGKLLGLHKNGLVYVLDSISFRKEYSGMAAEVYSCLLRWYERWGLRMVVIEDAANGTPLLSALGHILDPSVPMDILAEHERALASTLRGRIVVVAEKASEGKETRAKAQTLWYTPQCRVMHPSDDCPWMESHLTQHLRFGSTEHDDDVDSTCQGLKHLALYAPPRAQGNYQTSAAAATAAPATSSQHLHKEDVKTVGGRRVVDRFMLPTALATSGPMGRP